jgi:hypothetical protein
MVQIVEVAEARLRARPILLEYALPQLMSEPRIQPNLGS